MHSHRVPNPDENFFLICYNAIIVSPEDKIPPVKNIQNRAQKSEIGDTGDTGDILPISKEGIAEMIDNTKVQQQQFDCYHCDIFRTDIKKDYESQVVRSHPGKPCYPSKVDLDRFRLDSKRREWEV